MAEAIFIVRVLDHEYFVSSAEGAADAIFAPRSATFEVIKSLKGSTKKKEIKVFGDNGVLCRPYIDTFKEDRYYIVGLYKCNGKERFETTQDFYISICGEFWIEYNPDLRTVTGRIKSDENELTTMPLASFERLLKEN